MRYPRKQSYNPGSIQVSAVWRDGAIAYYTAWFTFHPGGIGRGETRSEAITNIPRQVRA